MQALRSHHAAELESERLRVAEVAERDKKVALDDATARFASERALMIQSHASTVEEAAKAHENAVQELQSKHACELESERLRVAAAVEQAKEAALDDATACFESERDRMARSHTSAVQQATTVHEDFVQKLQARHAAELESERLRLAETGERLKRRRWMELLHSLNRNAIVLLVRTLARSGRQQLTRRN